MVRQSLGNMESHPFYILFISFLVIVFWYAVYELVTETVDYIHYKYGIKKWKICSAMIIAVVLLIRFHPTFLERI
jgi:hypothetical protein